MAEPPCTPSAVELALRLEADRYRVLLDTAPNVILALKPDHTISEWNRAAELFFGVTRDNAIGTSYVDRFLPAEQRDAVTADIVKVLDGTPTYGFEDDALLPDGSRRTLLWNVTRLLDADGRPDGILAMAQDVTARAAAERRFRQMFERSADGLLLMRVPSGVVECNQAALAMLGIASAEALRDRHLAEFSPALQPDGASSAEKSLRMDAIAEETGFHRFEWMHRDASGEPLPVEVSLSYLGRERGEPLYLVTWHDLRPRKKAEAQREALEARLRHAERLEVVGRFAGGIAHDFNNLLTVIQLNLTLVRSEVAAALPEAGELQEELEEIGQASDRARALVQQVLAFSRKQAIVQRRVVVGELVANMEKLLCRVIGDEITLEVTRVHEEAAVFADAGQLEQVLLNLAVNARDAMLTPGHDHPGTGGVLEVRVDEATLGDAEAAEWDGIQRGMWVRITVRDTGHGMTTETCARVFEPFFTTKEVGQGTGLGLSTVLGIVQQAGGAVRASSAPGAGTTITILLPPAPALVSEAARQVVPPSPVAPPTGARILLVEDADAVREIARRVLERAGYVVHAVGNGRAALERWREESGAYDLVLTDVRMPELGGIELAAQLVVEAPDLPIVFMTGYAERGIPEGLVRRTVTLDKPFRVPQLLDAVAKLLVPSPR